MKKIVSLLYFLFACFALSAQDRVHDSLERAIKLHNIDSLRIAYSGYKNERYQALLILTSIAENFEEIDYDSTVAYRMKLIELLPQTPDSSKADTTLVRILATLGSAYMFHNLDSSLLFSKRALEYSRRLDDRPGEAFALFSYGESLRMNGEALSALEMFFRALSIQRDLGDKRSESQCIMFIGLAYNTLGESRTGLEFMFRGMRLLPDDDFKPLRPFILSNIGDAYEKLHIPDSALDYQLKAKAVCDSMKAKMTPLGALINIPLAKTYARRGDFDLARNLLYDAIFVNDYLNLAPAQYLLAELYYEREQIDSSLYYARSGFVNAQKSRIKVTAMEASRLLAKIFKARNLTDSAFHYQNIALTLTDSLFSPQKFNSLQLLVIRHQQRENEITVLQMDYERQKEMQANRTKVFGLLAVLLAFLLIAIILFRNNRQKQKANALLNEQKNEIAQAMTELKTTQAQLVQSEKMASLGELTAGIAHEIQNPLNFVNNFSELNRELVVDMTLELERGNYEEAKKIAIDLATNEIKINEHGKRADSIVKGMLQHSRLSTGQKEPTDINALCDEYLRLCYHGMRARDKSFNANMELQLDRSLTTVNVVPQDIGRVLLNICNNAFYAVNERRMSSVNGYSPEVTLATHKLGHGVEITVKDNGNGIAQKNLDKIFQPFFTTKPTGQGTGLGLSLSYDIIKAHGGSIDVKSIEGKGTEFVINLPI